MPVVQQAYLQTEITHISLRLKKCVSTHSLHLSRSITGRTHVRGIHLRPLCSCWQKKSSGVRTWATIPQNSSPTFRVNTLGIRSLLSTTVLFLATSVPTSSGSPGQKTVMAHTKLIQSGIKIMRLVPIHHRHWSSTIIIQIGDKTSSNEEGSCNCPSIRRIPVLRKG